VYVALTERDPQDWAESRMKNHEMLLCKGEYSYDGLGPSEFDLIGCQERAYSFVRMSSSPGGGGVKNDRDGVLHFWDVYRYRSPRDDTTDVDEESALRTGLMNQMKRHQELYLPLARYAPDIFDVRHSSSTMTKVKEESNMADDIRGSIMGGGDGGGGGSGEGGMGRNDGQDTRISVRVAPFDFGNFDKQRPTWKETYSTPLTLKTCMGRIVKCLMS
jgi:hypothetical protein